MPLLHRLCHQVALARFSICQLASGSLTVVSLDQTASGTTCVFYLKYADLRSATVINAELLSYCCQVAFN